MPSSQLRQDSEGAVSEVVGVVVMVALVVGMAAILFFWVGVGGQSEEAPIAMTLNSDGKVQSGTIALIVTSVSVPANWSDVSLYMGAKKLTYDESLSGGNKFCVAREGSGCINSLSWNPRSVTLVAGQTVYVHDAAIMGQTIEVIHHGSNAVITTYAVPERQP